MNNESDAERSASTISFSRPGIESAKSSEFQNDHSERSLADNEQARIWRHPRLSGVEMLRGSYRRYKFARHFHRVPIIGVVDHGSMSSYYCGANHILGTGTTFLLNPGEIHAPAPAGSPGWSFRVLFLEEDIFKLAEEGSDAAELRFASPFVNDPWLASSLLKLHHELEMDGDTLHLESSLVSIFSHLSRRYTHCKSRTTFHRKENKKIRMAVDYLQANRCHNVTLSMLSMVTGLSSFHLLRTFRSVTGLTPHEYLIQLRIETAKHLLRRGTEIAKVASELGFTDQSHLSRHFKRIMGVTPGRYIPRLHMDRRRVWPATTCSHV